MKRAVDIEKLLSWEYCDELPKRGIGSPDRI